MIRLYNPENDDLFTGTAAVLRSPQVPEHSKEELRVVMLRHTQRLLSLMAVDAVAIVWFVVLAIFAKTLAVLLADCVGVSIFVLFALREWEERDVWKRLADEHRLDNKTP